MGKNSILTYVTIQNPENYMAYIPVIRPFSGDSISDIKENLQNQRHVISFAWDSADTKSKKHFVQTLTSLLNIGAELKLFRDFYNSTFDHKEIKEIPLELIIRKFDTVSIDGYLRVPITMKQLIRFAEHELDMYTLYVASDFNWKVKATTVLYLDDYVEVDDGDNEIYPPFAKERNLMVYFHGDIVSAIIENTREQLIPKIPTVNDYIKNFNYYCAYDAFYDFEVVL